MTTGIPWPWWAIGLALIFVLIYLADRYDNRRLPQARTRLDQEMHQRGSAVLVGSGLDTMDPDAASEQYELEREFSDQVVAWLRFHNEFKEPLS